jgi:hypothetical protein
MGPATTGRERLEARDREQPGGDGGAPLKSASLLPHIEEHIAQEILGHGLVADKPEQPTETEPRCRAKSACMASLSPAAMRVTSISSEEYSPVVAAFAGTAAAADPDRINV